jgi:hypothetical protein
MSKDYVIRFMITHEVKYGAGEHWNCYRKMFGPRQGRNTHATVEEAQKRLDLLLRDNTKEMLKQFGVDKDTLKIMACPCYPGHFDPSYDSWEWIDPSTLIGKK